MLGQDGRISVVGRSGGAVPEFNTATLFFKRNRIGGVAVGAIRRNRPRPPGSRLSAGWTRSRNGP